MYIIEITHLFPNYCEEITEDFGCRSVRYFQVDEQLRMTLALYEDEMPYFLFHRKDKTPVDRMAYLSVAVRCHKLYPDILMPYRANQWYNEDTGVLHARPAYGRGNLNG